MFGYWKFVYLIMMSPSGLTEIIVCETEQSKTQIIDCWSKLWVNKITMDQEIYEVQYIFRVLQFWAKSSMEVMEVNFQVTNLCSSRFHLKLIY